MVHVSLVGTIQPSAIPPPCGQRSAVHQDDPPTASTLEQRRSASAQGAARSCPAHPRCSCPSVGFLREAIVSPRSDPNLRHHEPVAVRIRVKPQVRAEQGAEPASGRGTTFRQAPPPSLEPKLGRI